MAETLPRIASSFTFRVVGVTFVVPGYPENIIRLDAIAARSYLNGQTLEPLPAVLLRDPDNPYDANAIAVDVPAVGPIGHVPRALAARLAPHLDAGEVWQAHVVEVLVSPDNPANPGIDIRVQRVTT